MHDAAVFVAAKSAIAAISKMVRNFVFFLIMHILLQIFAKILFIFFILSYKTVFCKHIKPRFEKIAKKCIVKKIAY